MFEEGVGCELGAGAARLKAGRSGEDREQIAPLVVRGGAGPRAVLWRGLALLCT